MAAQWPAVAGHSAQWSRAVITRISISILALLALSLPASDADAQANADDFQIWTSMSLSGRLNSRLEIRGDGVFQATNDASRAGRELVRVVLLAQIDDRIMAGGGYVWTHVDAGGAIDFVEQRAVQEFDFRTAFAGGAVDLILRTQLEERWREAERRISLRLRQLTRLEAPLPGTAIRAVLWDEYFHELRSTGWSGRAGPALMINFIGIRIPVRDGFTIEPGYLNQTQFLSGPNRISHAAAFFARVRL